MRSFLLLTHINVIAISLQSWTWHNEAALDGYKRLAGKGIRWPEEDVDAAADALGPELVRVLGSRLRSLWKTMGDSEPLYKQATADLRAAMLRQGWRSGMFPDFDDSPE